MITNLSSGNLSVTPATRECPRIVTPEAIAAFELGNPALRGIGEIMQDLGLWVVTNENSDSGSTRAKVHPRDTQCGARIVYQSIGAEV